jgi:multidrug resistance efflux pump
LGARGYAPAREIEKLQLLVKSREATVAAATAAKEAAQARVFSQLPADKASAEAEVAEAEVELSKTVVRVGVSGSS